MTSILGTQSIQHPNGTNAMTIGSGGVVNTPNRPCFHVTKSADQTLTDATDTVVTFEEVTDGSHSGRTINKGGLFASNKLTVTSSTTGIYFVYASVFFQGSDILSLHGYFRKNGSVRQQIAYANGGWGNVNRFGTYFNHQIVNMDSAGDYLELVLYGDVSNNGTTNLNQNNPSGFQRTNMGGYLVG